MPYDHRLTTIRLWGFLHVIHHMKGMESDMSVMTEPQVGYTGPVMTPEEALADGARRAKGFVETVKAAARKVKNWFVQALRWAKDKVVRGYNWLRTEVPPAARQAWDWTRDKASRGWAWTKSSSRRLWTWAAPARQWVRDSAFIVADGVLTVASWVVLGPKGWLITTLVGTAIGVIYYRSKKRKPALVKGLVVTTMTVNDAQGAAINKRIQVIQTEIDKYDRTGNKNQRSNWEGRRYMNTTRLAGDERTPEVMAAQFKAEMLDRLGKVDANKFYDWSSVEKGLIEENKVVAKLLAENGGVSIV